MLCHRALNGGKAMGGISYGDGRRRSALILSADQSLFDMARACGLVPFVQGDDVDWPVADIIIADIRSSADAGLFAAISQYRQSRTVPMLAWAGLQGLDAAYAALDDADTHWLVDGSMSEAVALLATLAHQPRTSVLREERDALDYAALHRISDELAGFAQILQGFAGQNRKAEPSFRAPVSFRKSTASERATPLDPEQIRELIRVRRLRDHYFQAGLFGEPAWDILLDLMAAKLERVDVSVSSLCIAAAVPPTTALRCITAMTGGGMLERRADPHDARRIFITLSSGTEAAMRRYLAETLG